MTILEKPSNTFFPIKIIKEALKNNIVNNSIIKIFLVFFSYLPPILILLKHSFIKEILKRD